MELSKPGIAVVVAVCVTAGAGLGYLATREITPTARAQSSTSPLDEDATDRTGETAALVDDIGGAPGLIAAPAPQAARAASPVQPPVAPRRAPAPASPAPRPAPPVQTTAPPPLEFEVQGSSIVPASIEPEPPSFHLAAPIAPAGPELHEIEIAVDSVIGLQVESSVSSEDAAIEDEVVARVTRDVRVGGYVAIPAGATAIGEVTFVERGGKVRERAQLAIRFTSIVLPDGTYVPIATETIYREGDSPGRETAAKVGVGAIGGAILGGILGGGKGAAIGGSVGAGAGSAAVLAGGRNPAVLSAGSPLTIRLQEPARVIVEP